MDDDREFIEKQKEVIVSSYEQAKSYSNIIIFGGYAGIFAIWNFTRSELESWQVLIVGLFVLLSLFFFISSELYGLWLRTTQNIKLLGELESAERLGEFPDEYGKSQHERAKQALKLWPFFFYPAVGFALLATLILMFSFIKLLLCGNVP